jgi:hypothetical protein
MQEVQCSARQRLLRRCHQRRLGTRILALALAWWHALSVSHGCAPTAAWAWAVPGLWWHAQSVRHELYWGLLACQCKHHILMHEHEWPLLRRRRLDSLCRLASCRLPIATGFPVHDRGRESSEADNHRLTPTDKAGSRSTSSK